VELKNSSVTKMKDSRMSPRLRGMPVIRREHLLYNSYRIVKTYPSHRWPKALPQRCSTVLRDRFPYTIKKASVGSGGGGLESRFHNLPVQVLEMQFPLKFVVHSRLVGSPEPTWPHQPSLPQISQCRGSDLRETTQPASVPSSSLHMLQNICKWVHVNDTGKVRNR